MSEQATGGAPAGAPPAAPNGGMPLPATRDNFMENMRAKDAQRAEQARSARALGQRTPQTSQNPVGDRARAAEQQAKATPPANQTPPEAQDENAGGVSRETPPEGAPEAQADPNQPQEAAETTVLDGDELFAKAKEWRDSPTLPKEFEDRLIEAKVIGLDGRKTTELMSVAQMKENGMRQYDYSRSLDIVRAKDADIGRREQRMQQHFEKINSPDDFLAVHEDMGYSDVMDAALLKYAERKQRERSLIRTAGMDAMRRYQCDENDQRVHRAMELQEQDIVEARKAKLENRRMTREREAHDTSRKQEEQQRKSAQSAATLKRSLDQLMPVAFKAYGVAPNGANETDFYRHLKAVTDNDREWDGEVISIQHCMRAAEGLAQELGDRRGHNPTVQPRKAAPLAGPRLSGTGSARAAARQEQTESKRPSDFAAQYLRRGF